MRSQRKQIQLYILDAMSPEDRENFESRLQRDARLKENVDFIRLIYTVLTPSDLYIPRPDIWAEVKQHNPFKVREKVTIFARLKELTRELVNRIPQSEFEPVTLVPAFRGPHDVGLNYEADSFLINVMIQRTSQPEQRYLCGLILDQESKQPVTNECVSLNHPDWTPQTTMTDESGNFTFLALTTRPGDVCELSIDLPDQIIRVQDIPIGDF